MSESAHAREDPKRREIAEVLDLLRGLSMEVHAYLTDVGRGAGLAASDVACLGITRQAERDGVSLSAGVLGRRLGLSPAATTALIDRMTRTGLIIRDQSAGDARIVVVRTTAHGQVLGRELFGALNREYVRVLSEAFSAVPKHRRLLQELVEATERARAAEPAGIIDTESQR